MRRRRRDVRGTHVALHEDGVRRVVQCACDATAAYRGAEQLWAKGWGSHVEMLGEAEEARLRARSHTLQRELQRTQVPDRQEELRRELAKVQAAIEGRRIWECPDCWSPPRAPHQAPIYRADPAMLAVAEQPSGRARDRLERQLVRLLEVDPPRGDAYMRAIVEHLGTAQGAGAVRWRALEGLLPIISAAGARRKRRARPVVPGRALVGGRRVIAEVASEVVGVRFTPTEARALEALPQVRGAGSVGRFLRALVLCMLEGTLRPAAPPEAEP